MKPKNRKRFIFLINFSALGQLRCVTRNALLISGAGGTKVIVAINYPIIFPLFLLCEFKGQILNADITTRKKK